MGLSVFCNELPFKPLAVYIFVVGMGQLSSDYFLWEQDLSF